MKEKDNDFAKKFIYWLTCHPWLKLISLILAVLVWFYITGEINKYY